MSKNNLDMMSPWERRRLRYPSGRFKSAHELDLFQQLQPSLGWNPIINSGSSNRFRCGSCGALLQVGARDMQSEFEVKCNVCKHVMVFNRKSRGRGNR